MLLDYAMVIGRAAWVRHRAGYIGAKPPYSTKHLLETVFPEIPVSGADLPRGVTEMAIVDESGRRAIFYARGVHHASQRVGLMHGLYHHLSDLKVDPGLKECSLPLRKLGRIDSKMNDPVERACDLFAAEILVPLDVLDPLAPAVLFQRGASLKSALADEVDHLASRFNVPVGFMRWRLWDLHNIRQTHFDPEK